MHSQLSRFLRATALCSVAVATISFSTGLSVRKADAASAETYRELAKFGEIFDRVRSQYVDKPDDATLIKGAIDGMLSALDPHSRYEIASDFANTERQIKGEFGGIGVEVMLEDGNLRIVSAIDDTPATKAGLRANDTITAIDNLPVKGLSLSQAVEKLQGPIQSAVKLTVRHGGGQQEEQVRLVRDVVQVQSTKVQMKGDDIGYIRISQFTQTTFAGLQKGLAALAARGSAQKIRGYILDLRSNPGGLVDQAVDVADSFLDHGEIVSVRGRNADDNRAYFATGGDLTNGKPLIVLINGGSASASEIVAGALQDQKRATILGTLSFGKGTVQTIIPLPGQGALFLTTARYFTPSGRSIQATGIEPDIRVEERVPDNLKDQDMVAGESALKGHLSNPSAGASAPATENKGSSAYIPPDEKDDTQMNTAIRLIRGEDVNSAFPPHPEAYTQLSK